MTVLRGAQKADQPLENGRAQRLYSDKAAAYNFGNTPGVAIPYMASGAGATFVITPERTCMVLHTTPLMISADTGGYRMIQTAMNCSPADMNGRTIWRFVSHGHGSIGFRGYTPSCMWRLQGLVTYTFSHTINYLNLGTGVIYCRNDCLQSHLVQFQS